MHMLTKVICHLGFVSLANYITYTAVQIQTRCSSGVALDVLGCWIFY